MAGKQLTIEQALHCAKCNNRAAVVEECVDRAFSPGEVILIQCRVPRCGEKPWFYCKSCKRKQKQTGLSGHATRPKHQEAHALAYPPPPPDPPIASAPPYLNEAFCLFPNVDTATVGSEEMAAAMQDVADEVADNMDNEAMTYELADTYVMDGDNDLMDVVQLPEKAGVFSNFPVQKLMGNEWLVEEFKATELNRKTWAHVLAGQSCKK